MSAGNEIGDLLLDIGLITPEELAKAVEEQAISGERLTLVLERMGLVSYHQLKDALELQFGVNFFSLSKTPPSKETADALKLETKLKHRVIPVANAGTQYTIAMVNPDDLIALDSVRVELKSGHLKKVVCTADEFEFFVRDVYEVNKDGSTTKVAPPPPPPPPPPPVPAAATTVAKPAGAKVPAKNHLQSLFGDDDDDEDDADDDEDFLPPQKRKPPASVTSNSLPALSPDILLSPLVTPSITERFSSSTTGGLPLHENHSLGQAVPPNGSSPQTVASPAATPTATAVTAVPSTTPNPAAAAAAASTSIPSTAATAATTSTPSNPSTPATVAATSTPSNPSTPATVAATSTPSNPSTPATASGISSPAAVPTPAATPVPEAHPHTTADSMPVEISIEDVVAGVASHIVESIESNQVMSDNASRKLLEDVVESELGGMEDTDLGKLKEQQSSSIMLLAHEIIGKATQKRCSDIHLEPDSTGVTLRYFLHGELLADCVLPGEIHHSLVSSYKIIAGLDPDELDKPQDKKIVTKVEDDQVELRITTLPSDHGEMVAISMRFIGAEG